MSKMTILQSTIIGAKRKRAPVSYVDRHDDELDKLLGEDEQGIATCSEDDPDAYEDDMSATFGSKKKPPKLQATKKFKKTRKKDSKKTNPFPFMELPPEIRDLIYEFALTDSTDMAIVAHIQNKRRTVARRAIHGNTLISAPRNTKKRKRSKQTTNDGEPCGLAPALLAVSKQLHTEAVGFLYHQPLIFEEPHALHSFLAGIGSHREYIRDVVLQHWGYRRGTKNAMNFAAFPLLGLCTNLKSLTFESAIGLRTRLNAQPEKVAELVYRNMHFFLEAYGAAKGRRDAAVDVIVLGEEVVDATSHRFYAVMEGSSKEELRERFWVALRKLLMK
ncbi:hypothetical protein BTJ68_06780 [Hortaea werneckii EXF-2000]|uniref:2EXR domain-containing protein n=2 Tax=Hortaea werneckii TaxID=91943 RepID=A0A1Z5T943_HORWE|nr:hypothetical protein BTJ68_06780 [Hortaea werneckii EXF-2000]